MTHPLKNDAAACSLCGFITDLSDALLGRESADVSPARWRAKHTWPVIAEALHAVRPASLPSAVKALALPVALSLLALAMGSGIRHDVTN